MSATLSDFLKSEARQVHAGSERRKAEKRDWQRATEELVEQMSKWHNEADPEGVLDYRRTDHPYDDYGGSYVLKGLTFILGDTTVRIIPSNLSVVGVIQIPGESQPRRIDGRVEFDNGIDRIPLYRVKIGDHDRWFWWTHGGVGKPFDRESFEATLVSLLR